MRIRGFNGESTAARGPKTRPVALSSPAPFFRLALPRAVGQHFATFPVQTPLTGSSSLRNSQPAWWAARRSVLFGGIARMAGLCSRRPRGSAIAKCMVVFRSAKVTADRRYPRRAQTPSPWIVPQRAGGVQQRELGQTPRERNPESRRPPERFTAEIPLLAPRVGRFGRSAQAGCVSARRWGRPTGATNGVSTTRSM